MTPRMKPNLEVYYFHSSTNKSLSAPINLAHFLWGDLLRHRKGGGGLRKLPEEQLCWGFPRCPLQKLPCSVVCVVCMYKASCIPSGAPLKTNLPTEASLHFFQITASKRCLMLLDAINSRENNNLSALKKKKKWKYKT